MEWFVELSSFLSFIISVVTLIYVFQFSNANKTVKILVILLFITILGANLLNFIDFYHGIIEGIMES